jgi:hypothetical protein
MPRQGFYPRGAGPRRRADRPYHVALEERYIRDHWGGELAKAALLSTMLSVGSEVGSGADNGNNTAILQALRLGAANSLNQTGQQVVRRNLNIQPTLTIRPGFPVRVIVNRDLILEPYRGWNKMAKLKLTALSDEKPVKVAVELPAPLHRDLLAYEILAHQSGQPISEPTKLIAPMLARFMATDRAFVKSRKLRHEGRDKTRTVA